MNVYAADVNRIPVRPVLELSGFPGTGVHQGKKRNHFMQMLCGSITFFVGLTRAVHLKGCV
jgi:hypothetical protein